MFFKALLIFLLLLSCLWAKGDYSDLSTEELIALIGYITPENESKLLKELDKRIGFMNEEEKRLYLELKESHKDAQE